MAWRRGCRTYGGRTWLEWTAGHGHGHRHFVRGFGVGGYGYYDGYSGDDGYYGRPDHLLQGTCSSYHYDQNGNAYCADERHQLQRGRLVTGRASRLPLNNDRVRAALNGRPVFVRNYSAKLAWQTNRGRAAARRPGPFCWPRSTAAFFRDRRNRVSRRHNRRSRSGCRCSARHPAPDGNSPATPLRHRSRERPSPVKPPGNPVKSRREDHIPDTMPSRPETRRRALRLAGPSHSAPCWRRSTSPAERYDPARRRRAIANRRARLPHRADERCAR